jgi:hypothetical protein
MGTARKSEKVQGDRNMLASNKTKDDRKLCLGDGLFFISMEVYEKRESLEIWRSPRGTEGSKSRGTKAMY